MLKMKLIFILVAMVIVLLPGCGTSEGEEIAESTASEIPVNTEFGRMLGFVPYSFLEEHDIWFNNPGKAKQLHGFEDITSWEAVVNIPGEERQSWADAIRELNISSVTGLKSTSEWIQVFGFDSMMASRSVFVEMPPPGVFSIMEGDFDEDLIIGKLQELGYEETKHGSYTYHKIFGDYNLNLDSKVTRIAMASMNRVAVLDDTIITAPATDIITGILDAMAGDVNAVIDNAACRALADSMGEVLAAGIITPDRVLDRFPGSTNMPPFNFSIPEDWGLLHQYDMVGMGYKDDGEERFWVISLYYSDTEAASADAGELVKRMEGYAFSRSMGEFGGIEQKIARPLTDWVEVGEPAVWQYPSGSTLTVECRYHETGTGSWLLIATLTRDLLFLVPDPSLFVEE